MKWTPTARYLLKMDFMRRSLRTVGLSLAVLLALIAFVPNAMTASAAAESEKAEFDIPAQRAPQALRDFAEQADLKILFPQKEIQGRTLKGVSGYLGKKEALFKLLEGEGLSFRFRDGDTVTVFPTSPVRTIKNDQSSSSVVEGEFQLAQAATNNDVPARQRASVETQPSTTGSVQVLEEITVSAQKRDSLLRETPVSMTNLGNEALLRHEINSILDMEHFVPGLKIGQFYSAAKVTIRGIGNENLFLGGDPGVAFHVDNVYIARTEAAMAAFFDVDRIEVLRGPQGTLYGRNATGGTINVINKAPTEDVEGQIFVEAGNFDKFGGGAVLSGPIAGDRLLGRLSFRARDSDGYVKNIVPGMPDLNSQEFFSVRAQLLFQPNDDLSIHIRADYHEDDDTGPSSKTLGTLFGPSFPELFFGGTAPVGDFITGSTVDSFHKTEFAGVSATVEWNLGSVALTSITAYRDSQIDTFVDADGTDFQFQTLGFVDASEQVTQELRLASNSDGSLEWMIGAYYFNDKSTQDVVTDVAGLLISADPLILIPVSINLGGDLDTESYAVFGNATWKISESFHLNAGLRYTDDKKKVSEFNDLGGLFGPIPFTGVAENSWDEVTYNVGVQYFPFEKTMLFVTLSKGFKGGGYNVGALTPAFDPEKALNVEAGVKARFFGDRAELNATVFYTNYDNLQVAQVIGFSSIVSNAAKAKLQGLEIEGALAITDAFRLRGTFSYLDATFKEYSNVDIANFFAGVQDLSGRHLPNSPEVSFSIVPEYTVDVGNLGTLTMYGAFYWQDRTFLEPFNNQKFSQKAVGRFDVGATLESDEGGWRITAYGKNLGDKEVLNSLIVGSATIGAPGISNVSSARTYGVRVEYNF